MADIKDLRPEDRIKKLKELEKEKKKEIAEAEKMIKDSQEEITERKRWAEKVPIPEVAKEDLDNLSEEGKKLLKEHRGIEKKTVKEEEVKKHPNLEEAVEQEQVQLPPEARGVEYGPGQGGYQPLSQMDLVGISREIKDVYSAVEERGYMTSEEQNKVGYALSEVERRLESVEEGRYKGFTEEVAEAASLIQAVGSQMYNSSKSTYK